MIDIMSCVVDIWTVIDMRGDPFGRLRRQRLSNLGHVLTGLPKGGRAGRAWAPPRGRQVPASLHFSRVWVAFASGPACGFDLPTLQSGIGPTVLDESGRLVSQCTVIRSPVSGGIVAATSAATVASSCRRSRNQGSGKPSLLFQIRNPQEGKHLLQAGNDMGTLQQGEITLR